MHLLYWIDQIHLLKTCKANIYVSRSTSELRVRLALRNRLKPSSKSIFTDRSIKGFFCGSFLLVIVHVGVCFNVVPLCNRVVTCWERADLLAVVFVVFCHFPKRVLVHIRIKGEVGAMKLV